MIYSHNVSFGEWASVYTEYYQAAAKACNGKPTVVVQHSELTASPYTAVTKLYNDLVAVGVQGLTLPAEARVSALLKPSKKEQPLFLGSERKAVGAAAAAISTALSQSPPSLEATAASWLVTPRKAKEAVATLLTTDNA